MDDYFSYYGTTKKEHKLDTLGSWDCHASVIEFQISNFCVYQNCLTVTDEFYKCFIFVLIKYVLKIY